MFNVYCKICNKAVKKCIETKYYYVKREITRVWDYNDNKYNVYSKYLLCYEYYCKDDMPEQDTDIMVVKTVEEKI